MATSKITGLRFADLPAINVARFADNPAATQALEQIRQTLAIRFGLTGQPQDRAVTWGDLVESGFASLTRSDGSKVTVTNPGGNVTPNFPESVDGIPPAPTGLTVSAGLATIMLGWDQPSFSYFGYAQIYRNTVDNQATATMVGETSAWVYADPINASATYYYWVRFVSKGGQIGPFNAVAGTSGTTSLDPAYLIDVLSAAGDPNALLYTIPEDTVINGVAVPAGLYMRDIYVANGSLTNAKIGNEEVDDSKIANLSAAKVTFGVMSGDRIDVASLNADRLISSTLVTALAAIDTAYVGTANIENAAVTNQQMSGPIYSDNYVANTTGWYLDRAGNLYANQGMFRGQLSGATGSFAGSLSAASGSFKGSLSAATGTFSGTLTADAINAVKTINIAGQSVTTYSGASPNIDQDFNGFNATSWTTLYTYSVYNPNQVFALLTVSGYTMKISGSQDGTLNIRFLLNGAVVMQVNNVTVTASGQIFPLSANLAYGGSIANGSSLTVQVQKPSSTDNFANRIHLDIGLLTAYR